MKMLAFAAAFLLLAIATCRAQSNEDAATRFDRWGGETLDAINHDFWLEERGLYAERGAVGDDRPRQPAFLWGAGVQLSALAAAARVDPLTYAAPLAAYADVLETHWIVHNGVGGYGVLPKQREADRYYDDNAWIVLALVETADATRDEKFLKRAEAALTFVLSGEDDVLGGGIYWRENRRNSKNACSNAPAIVAALRLYQKTSDPAHLATAQRLYDWTRGRLQDQSDGLFWDKVRRNGRVDRRKYSYNTALMIRANCLLFEIQGDAEFLAEAQRLARAAVAHWVAADTGAVEDGGRFAHLLLESLLAVWRCDHDARWLNVVEKSAAFVHDKVRDAEGRYPNRWDARPTRAADEFQLIDQASAARLYFVHAQALRERAATAASKSAASRGD